MVTTTSYNPSKKVSIKCTPTQYIHLRDFVKRGSIELCKILRQKQKEGNHLVSYSTCAASHQLLEKLNNKVAELSIKKNSKLYNFNLTAVEASCLVELLPYYNVNNLEKSNVHFYSEQEKYEHHIQPILDRIKKTTGIQ